MSKPKVQHDSYRRIPQSDFEEFFHLIRPLLFGAGVVVWTVFGLFILALLFVFLTPYYTYTVEHWNTASFIQGTLGIGFILFMIVWGQSK